jgi:hypothetical protein
MPFNISLESDIRAIVIPFWAIGFRIYNFAKTVPSGREQAYIPPGFLSYLRIACHNGGLRSGFEEPHAFSPVGNSGASDGV